MQNNKAIRAKTLWRFRWSSGLFLKEGRCSGKKEDFIAFAEIYGWLLWFVFLLMIFMMFLWAISFDLMLAGFQDKKRLNNVLFCFGGKYFPHIKQIQKFL